MPIQQNLYIDMQAFGSVSYVVQLSQRTYNSGLGVHGGPSFKVGIRSLALQVPYTKD